MTQKTKDPTIRMSGWQRFCYGMGLGGGAAIAVATGAMLVFCTNVLHIDPAVAGTVIAASKVLDGLSDLIAGRIVDRTCSRFGKARPWLLRMLLPTIICLMAAFTVPSSLSAVAKIVYVFVTYNLLSTVCYTMVSVSYTSMSSLITTNQYERGLNGIIGMTIYSLVLLALNTSMVQICTSFGNGDPYSPIGWRCFAAIIGVVYASCTLLTFLFCKEIDVETRSADHLHPKKKPVSTIRTLKALLTNKYWIQYVIALVSNTLGNTFITGAALFYAQFILGDENIYSTLSAALLLSMFIGSLATSVFIKRIGKRNTALIGLTILAVGTVLSGILPDTTGVSTVTLILRGFGAGFPSALGTAILQDTLTYGKWRNGFDMVGMGNAACSFTNKVGSGLGTAVLGWILALGGYDSYAAVQIPTAQAAIKFSFSWAPLVFVLITLVCFILYRLDKEYAGYEKDLSEGRYGPNAMQNEEK